MGMMAVGIPYRSGGIDVAMKYLAATAGSAP
jgi:hypothetical protein